MTETLLPCPFCGNDTAIAVLDSNEVDYMQPEDAGYRDNPYYQVVCCVNEISEVPSANWRRGCGGAGGFMPTKSEAIIKWNRRVAE